MRLGDGEFLDQQAARGIEHLALAEGEFLIALEDQQIAENLGDFERRTGLYLFGIFAIAAVPGLRIALDLALTQDFIDFGYGFLTDDPPQAHRLNIFGWNHDRHLFG